MKFEHALAKFHYTRSQDAESGSQFVLSEIYRSIRKETGANKGIMNVVHVIASLDVVKRATIRNAA